MERRRTGGEDQAGRLHLPHPTMTAPPSGNLLIYLHICKIQDTGVQLPTPLADFKGLWQRHLYPVKPLFIVFPTAHQPVWKAFYRDELDCDNCLVIYWLHLQVGENRFFMG